MLFPLLFLWRFRVSTIFCIVAIVAFCSLAFSEWASRGIPTINYYLLPSRAWELLSGSLCAFYIGGRQPKPNGWLAAIGLGLIAAAIFTYEPSTRIPSLLALFPVGGAALFLLFASNENLAGRLLMQPPFVWIGKISFSAYLWHQPVFAFWRTNSLEAPGPLVMVALMALVFILAAVTWLLIEQPFRHRKTSTFRLVGAVVGSVFAFAAIGAFGIAKDGLPSRLDPKLSEFMDRVTWSNHCLIQVKDGLPAFPMKDCIFDGDGNPDVAIWGDSIGSSIAPAMVEQLKSRGEGIVQLTHGSCAPIPGVYIARAANAANCDAFNKRAFAYLLKSEVKTVILAASWVGFFNESYLSVDGRERSRASVSVRSVEDNLSDTISRLQQDGKRVLLLYPGPRFEENVVDEMAAIMVKGDDTPTFEYPKAAFRKNTERAYSFLDAVSNADVRRIWPEKIFCRAETACTYGKDGTAYVADRVHYTDAGAILVADEIAEELLNAKVGGQGLRRDPQ